MKTIRLHTFATGLVLLLTVVPSSGCIREDRSGCLPETEGRYVVLKIMDTVTGRDITETGQAGDAVLYLFSPDGTYAGRLSVNSERITHHTPVRLPDGALGRCHVSVWANAETGQQLHIPAEGSRIEGRAVSLVGETGTEDAYRMCPDDLFFGHMQLTSAGGESPEEVTITRKNARMHITVRGLDGTLPAERYYFTVRIPDDGYDFVGKPAAGTATVRRAGEFDANGDFSTNGAFNLVHTDPSASETEVTVRLYEKSAVRATDRLICSVTTGSDGRPISLPEGRTVNLLIDIGSTAGIDVRTEITPWNEIYQWETW